MLQLCMHNSVRVSVTTLTEFLDIYLHTYIDEEFVVVSHDEVPSQEEAERTANPPPDTDTTEAEHDGPNSDVSLPYAFYNIITH